MINCLFVCFVAGLNCKRCYSFHATRVYRVGQKRGKYADIGSAERNDSSVGGRVNKQTVRWLCSLRVFSLPLCLNHVDCLIHRTESDSTRPVHCGLYMFLISSPTYSVRLNTE